MFILGLESSCDETAASVVEMSESVRKIRSNIIASQIDVHKLYGGVVPEIASRAHIEAVSSITYRALEEAGITLKDLSAIAVTTHPGLIGALLVGVNFAKSLALAYGIPLIPVNHIHAHVFAAGLERPELVPPYLALVISGGHTAFYSVKTPTEFVEIGSTRDDAAGEAFDKIARVMGMPYPGGVAMDRLAHKGNPSAILFPSPALAGDTLDFSFSGLKTAALNYLHSKEQKGEPVSREDVAASYTRVIVDGISKKTQMALDQPGSDTFVLSGGVSANSHIRKELEELCSKRNVRFFAPPLSLCGDNGAMVAAAGYFEYLAGHVADSSLNASAEDYPDDGF